MRNRFVPILIGLLVCLCPLPVFAAEEGSIEVSMPEGMAGETITILREGEEKQSITVDENGSAKIEKLSEGIYEIEITETSEYTFMTAKVSIPTWSEEEHKMLYDITVIPKYVRKETPVPVSETMSPLTSDSNHNQTYISTGIISLIILVIISCHNRFNCDTITGKYSKNGGHNNGNDNDTENPRCTRRIGLSSPGSID